MRRRVIALVLLIFCASSFAQTPDTAIIRGTVTDPSGAVIPGANVILTSVSTGQARTATTTASGTYVFAGLPGAVKYDIRVEASGFSSTSGPRIEPTPGSTQQLNIVASLPKGGTIDEVIAPASDLRTDQPQLGTEISPVQVAATPTLNRRITYLPLLNAANRPAISQGDVFTNQNLFTTNGAGRRQTWFEVDGGNAVDLWGRQTIFSTIPVDSVQEMTVLTNAFSAEFGSSTGSVVNIVTRSGGEDFHGSLIGLWRPSEVAAKLSGFTPATATAGSQITSDFLKQMAAQLTGPVGASGRTHFSINGEYSWQNRTSPITAKFAPGSFVGKYRGWLGFLKLDHEFNDRHSLFFRSDVDSFLDSNPNGLVGGNSIASVGRAFKRRTYTTQLGETATLSSSLLNAFRAQFQLASPVTEFDPFVYGTQFSVPIAGQGTYISGTSQYAKLQNHQFELTDTFSWSFGRHTLKFGADLIRAHNGGQGKEFGGPFFLGQFTYKTCAFTADVCESAAYLNDINNVQSYSQSFGNANYVTDDSLWSLFAQDDFRLRQNFTVNLGLRYERQTFTDAARNFAPRLGFAWDLGGHGKTVLRGGYGIYYSQIPDNAAANYALGGPTGVFTFSASAGQVGFPTSVSAAPLTSVPSGANIPVRSLYLRPGRASYYDQFLPTSVLNGYPDALLNPYSQQWTLSLERSIADRWVLSVDYVGSHTIKINRPLDLDAPASFVRTAQGQTRSAAVANCTRPYWVWWYQQQGTACTGATPPYGLVTVDVNNGYANYNALDLNLNHRFNDKFSMLASYTWSHALDNVDPDIPQQNPNDANLTGKQEYGDAIFDQRHRFVLSGIYQAPWKFRLGGVMSLSSGLPYNWVTGTTNSGDIGGTTDRPVIDGVVVRRNAGRGRAMYDVSPFVEREFAFGEKLRANLRAESFNLFNHPNFVGYAGTYGNGTSAPPNFGTPLPGMTSQLPARSFQFTARVSF